MGKFKCFDYTCEHCGHDAAGVVLDLNEDDPEHQPCPECGKEMTKCMAAPMVMNASYPDGVRRADFQAEKLANKMRIESYNKPPSERGEYQKEIAKVKQQK